MFLKIDATLATDEDPAVAVARRRAVNAVDRLGKNLVPCKTHSDDMQTPLCLASCRRSVSMMLSVRLPGRGYSREASVTIPKLPRTSLYGRNTSDSDLLTFVLSPSCHPRHFTPARYAILFSLR